MVDAVAILSAGAQYTKVIDRRVRELNVKCDILPLSLSAIAIDLTSKPPGTTEWE